VHARWFLPFMTHCSFILCCRMNIDYYVWLLHSFMLDFEIIITKIRYRFLSEFLEVAWPSLWVVGYVTNWYQSFWFKHRTGMGRNECESC
jgi:hypothetical protein